MKEEADEKKIIYYDGNCPMCNVFADTVSKNDQNQILIDVNKKKPLGANLKTENLLKEIHLFDRGTVRTGPDAVLTSLAQIYPILKPLVFLVRLPLINWLARQIYFFISERRLLFFGGETARLYWLFLITNIGLLIGILISWPAWQSDRLYPLSPITGEIDWLNQFTLIFTGLLVLSLGLSLWQKRNLNLFSLVSLLSLIPLVFLDITRLQPWVFHYGALLFLLTYANFASALRTTQILDASRLIVVGIYFWSGVQKMNTAFITEVFTWVSKPLWTTFGDPGLSIAFTIGIVIPFIEAAFAIGLLTKRFRKISIIGSGLMLIFITLVLILGHSWNIVVWPWNFAIFAMVFILFYRLDDTLPEIINRSKKNILALLALIFFILMPIGNFFGQVDHYLSWSLYSGHVPTAFVTANHTTINHLIGKSDDKNLPKDYLEQISFVTLSTKNMNLVPYPEERVFFNIFNNLCQNYPESNLIFTLDTRPAFLSHKAKVSHYTCEEVSLLSPNK